MLNVALEKMKHKGDSYTNLEFVKSDMRNFAFNKKFNLIIIPFRGFQCLLTVEDQISTLINIKKHLNSKSRLIITLFVFTIDSFPADFIFFCCLDLEQISFCRTSELENRSF